MKSVPVILVAVWLSTHILATAAEPSAQRPNIVIFAPDGLRADRIGAYGYQHHPTTPAIDAAAGESLFFENAEAQSSWTLPSFASLFTSQYPWEHAALWSNVKISSSSLLLSELLAMRGYRTAAFVGSPFLSPEYGFARGFGFYNADGQRYFQETLPLALNWIKSNRSPQPFFLFIHGNDLQPPFNPFLPKTVRDRFDPAYQGPASDLLLDSYFLRVFNRCEWHDRGPAPDEEYKAKVEVLRSNARALKHIGALYDAQLARVDEAFQRLMNFLKRENLAANTVVVLLSDHGLELGERGLLGAGDHPVSHETVTRVPLLLWGPGIAAGRRKDVVQLIDVAPTLLSLAATPSPLSYQGRDLLSPRAAPHPAIGASTTFDASEIKEYFLRDEQWKLIYRLDTRSPELFNLADDSEERRDLSLSQAERARKMLADLLKLTSAPD